MDSLVEVYWAFIKTLSHLPMWLLILLPGINLLLMSGSAIILAYRTHQRMLKWFALLTTLVSACVGCYFYGYLNANLNGIIDNLYVKLLEPSMLVFFLATCLFLWFCVKEVKGAK
jgi:hypothetical protein